MPVTGKEIVTKLTVDSKGVAKGLSEAEKTVLKFSAVVAGISASMAAAATYTAQWQDATIKASRAAGTSVEAFSALAVAAEKSGVSTEELTKSLTKLNTTTPELAKNLASVGVSLNDSNGKLKTSEILLGDVAEQMKKYKNPADQAMVATKVFGEEGAKLVSMLKDGKAGLAAARVEAEKYGLVVSEQAGKAAEKFNDDMTESKLAIKGLTSALGESLIAWANQGGIMNIVRDTIASVTQMWRGLSSETKNVIITAGAVLTAISAIVAAIIALNAILPSIKAALATAFGPIGLILMGLTVAIVGFVKFLSEYAEDAKKIFGPIAEAASTAWKALKGMGDAIANLFQPVGSSELQEHLKRTGKNMGEAQKGASAFGKVMAAVGAAISVTLQTVAQLFTQLSIGFETAAKNIGHFRDAYVASLSGNREALNKSFDNIYKDTVDGTKKSLDELSKYTKGVGVTIDAALNVKPPKINIDTSKITAATDKTLGLKASFTALGLEITQTGEKSDRGITQFKNKMLSVAEAVKKATDEALGYFDGVGAALKSVTNVIVNASKYSTQVQLRDIEVLEMRSKKAFEEMRAAAEAEEAAKTAALTKSYDDQIEALKGAEAEKTAAVEFEAKQRLLLNDQEYQTAKAQAEAAHAAFMEAERARFESEKALMDEKTYDKEQRRLNEGVMDANYAEYVKAQEALFQQQLNDLAKGSTDKNTKINADAKAKVENDTKANAERIKALEVAKAEALKANEEQKNKRLAELDAARTDQEKAEEKRRLQIQYDAEVQEFEQTKAMKIVDVMVSGISAAAMAFGSMAAFGPFGIAIGAALAATIMGATFASISQINSQRPVKPAALIAEEGGFAVGARHSSGGINTEIEDGELITSRGRTRALFDALDEGAFDGGSDGPAVVFQNCTFNSTSPQEMGDMINELIGSEVRRLGIVGA